ncbi:unnamed protein product [Brassica rapa]|uniref:Uncharacterized protein n=1 Tax=Brassica campestris TaxID=3711 RepID=A0A8D9MD94_BRACM|nr:unnamed protein product [Brassica rapa]
MSSPCATQKHIRLKLFATEIPLANPLSPVSSSPRFCFLVPTISYSYFDFEIRSSRKRAS